ncbi:toxin VasX [Xenophilus aerolatus]
MPCPSPCSNCERKGLPILIARYAAAYSARQPGMAELRKLQPVAPLDPRPGGVALQTALYNVRLLREGYLYLLIEREGAMPEWQGHVVNPHGYPAGLVREHRSERSAAHMGRAGLGGYLQSSRPSR